MYTDTLSFGKALKITLLCLATAWGIAFSIPNIKTFRRYFGLALAVAMPYILGTRLELLTIDPDRYLPFAQAWNIGLMYFLELVIFLCTQSLKASVCTSTLLLTILYSANCYIYTFRGSPLYINEITADGNHHSWDEKDESMQLYHILQYYRLFDS